MNINEKREIIMENYLHPINKDIPHEGYTKINTRNESCIDNINLYIKWNDNKIEDITFDGEACAISISSTSLMIKNLIGATNEEALIYIKEFYRMTNGDQFNPEVLKEAVAYEDITKQSSRKICVNLPLKGLEKAILEQLK